MTIRTKGTTKPEERAANVARYEEWYTAEFGHPPLPSMAETYERMSGEQMTRAHKLVSAHPLA